MEHVIIFLLCLLTISSTFHLDGSSRSFAEFSTWHPGLNGSIELEFSTEEPSGILLYADDGGKYDFFEAKVVEGALRLRLNYGESPVIMTAGKNLNDGQWHKLLIVRKGRSTKLQVDDDYKSRISKGSDLEFGSTSSNSPVWIGGIPIAFNRKLSELALPSVVFEPRLKGAVRNLQFVNGDGTTVRPEMVRHMGVRMTDTDACSEHNPCQNNAMCISTDTGAICDCKHTDFQGDFCEKEKKPAEATFKGEEYLSYNLSTRPIISNKEQISFYFKTPQPSGLLFFSGDRDDYLIVALEDGGVRLWVNLGSGITEAHIKEDGLRFDDNRWHKVLVRREIKKLYLTVDDKFKEKGAMAGDFETLSSKNVYVGGSGATHRLPGGHVRNNFVGCLRKVVFKPDNLHLDLTNLARKQHDFLTVHGNVAFECQEDEVDPITFTTSDSHLTLPTWDALHSGRLSFDFKTNEPHGLLLYNNGPKEQSQSDYFALELMDGHLYLIINLGSGVTKVKASQTRVDNGRWHSVKVERDKQMGRISTDGTSTNFKCVGKSKQLDLKGPLFIGGLDVDENTVFLPREVWSAMLRHGFVGCMKHLCINETEMDLAAFAQSQDPQHIRPYCRAMKTQCEEQPCMNEGVCREGWNRFVCDCTSTAYSGSDCTKVAPVLSFDDKQTVKIQMLNNIQMSEAEDISLRFKTSRPNGLLLSTGQSSEVDYLVVSLEAGQAKLTIDLGAGHLVLYAGNGLNNKMWHSIHMKRRAGKVEFKMDDETPVTGIARTKGDHTVLEFKTIELGSVESRSENAPSKNIPSFIGSMQQFLFNGNHFFEMARGEKIANFEITAAFGDYRLVVQKPATFMSPQSYIGLPTLEADERMNIHFQLKTFQSSGLILYHRGPSNDFMALELVHGHIHYAFNLGDGSATVRSNTLQAINDDEWHDITIIRPSLEEHILIVDRTLAKIANGGSAQQFNLAGYFYIGGVEKNSYLTLSSAISSREGYQGCLASFSINGQLYDVVKDSITSTDMVVEGCNPPTTECTEYSCANRGSCFQERASYRCDCDMTSYSGPTCSDDSIGYTFGPAPGLVRFKYPRGQEPDTKADVMSLGFRTRQQSAVLVRVDSSISDDYMELELVDGNIFMVYNMGSGDHPVSDLSHKVDDGRYHVLRFTRSGPNATLQLDDHAVKVKHPSGATPQLGIFNTQSMVTVGGKRAKGDYRAPIQSPFVGRMAGLVFNGHRILELAADNDARIKIEGQAELTSGIEEDEKVHAVGAEGNSNAARGTLSPQGAEKTTKSWHGRGKASGPHDAFVGSGNGCDESDDEDCDVEGSTSDEIVTPKYIRPRTTPSPPTTTPASEVVGGSGSDCNDEDEECLTSPEESGSGPMVEPEPEVTTMSTLRLTTTDDFFLSSPASSDVAKTPEPPVEMVTALMTQYATPRRPTPASVHTTPSPFDDSSSPQSAPQENSSDKAESMGLIIGIAAAGVLLLILIVIIIFKCRKHSDGSYKVDESKNYQFVGGTGPITAQRPGPPAQAHHAVNGTTAAMKPGAKNSSQRNGKSSKKKDVKEWYV